MKIVILDKDTLGADIDLSPLYAVGECTEYGTTAPEQIAARVATADVIVTNKLKLGAHNLQNAAALRLICVAATGYDNIDTVYCQSRGIALCNVPGYSTESVAQLSVTMALSLATHLTAYRNYTHSGEYTASGIANRLEPLYHETSSLTWGVVGGGGIGTRVAEIARALGCRVQMCRRKAEGDFPLCDIDTLCRTSDIISLHVPLSDSTRGLINRERIAAMKKGAIVVNTARGAVTDEAALAEAVLNGHLGGLGVDVYSVEPFSKDHPFWALRERENVCLTPHMAWGSVEARARCVSMMAENITRFFAGERHNRVV
ncbi:MAG: hydroxyacid dehydrogenase [Ruminococcaceae bacterium]|nr:hydroxyacid dehydrogenase [Oscillospiraceae bacterium]